MDGLQAQLAEAKEVAQARLEEVELLSTQLAQLKMELDSLHLAQHSLPEAMVKDSATYKTLQTQFTIAAQESSQLCAFLEEAKALLMSARQQHFTQLEEIRCGLLGEELYTGGWARYSITSHS